MRLRLHPRTGSGPQRDSGYILLVLMLWVSILSMTVALPMVYYYRQQMARDREEEMVHRGVEYERAVRKYYRKFGSYPQSLEMLESSNHMRFLRKRYNDPITGKDFKVLTQADVMVAFAAGIPGATMPGGQSLGQSVTDMTSGAGSTPAPTPAPAPAPTPASSDGSEANAAGPDSGTPNNSGTTLPFSAKPTPAGSTTQTFGGGGIVGVASISKTESIRVFNKKNHYNEWLFAYNPQMDRGQLPRGPYEPILQLLPGQMGMPGQQLNGQQGQQGFGQQGSGQQGFGGMGAGNAPGSRH